MPKRFKLGDQVILFNNDGYRYMHTDKIHTITKLYTAPHPEGQWMHLDNNDKYWFNEHWMIGLKEIIGD